MNSRWCVVWPSCPPLAVFTSRADIAKASMAVVFEAMPFRSPGDNGNTGRADPEPELPSFHRANTAACCGGCKYRPICQPLVSKSGSFLAIYRSSRCGFSCAWARILCTVDLLSSNSLASFRQDQCVLRPLAFAALAGARVLVPSASLHAACCPDDGLPSPPIRLVRTASSSGRWWQTGFRLLAISRYVVPSAKARMSRARNTSPEGRFVTAPSVVSLLSVRNQFEQVSLSVIPDRRSKYDYVITGTHTISAASSLSSKRRRTETKEDPT